MPGVVVLIFYAIPLIIFNQNWWFWSEYVQKKNKVAHSALAGVNNNKLQRTFRLLNLQKKEEDVLDIPKKTKQQHKKIYRLMEYYHGRHFFSHFVPQFVCMIQRQKCYNCHVYSKIIRKPRTHKVLGKEPTQDQCRDLH